MKQRSSRDRSWGLRRAWTYLWQGPGNLSAPLTLEWRFTAVRWTGIVCILPALFLADLKTSERITCLIIVLLAVVYNLAIQWLIINRPAVLTSGYPTSIGDILLNVGMMLSLGQEFASPYGYFLVVIIVSVAMRFGFRLALAVTWLVIAINVYQLIASRTPIDAGFVFRSMFLVLTAALASYLREQADRDQAVLQQANQALHEAYADLARAHQELLTLDAAKTNFVANVSHELRTPLTSIRAYSELLLDYEDSRETQREFLGIINTESERLASLVGDVLDIMRIESGKMDWRPTAFDLGGLIRHSARLFALSSAECEVPIVLDLPDSLSPVYGDRDRLLQVFSNLLDNALKFTSVGTISVRVATSGGEIRVAVTDTGVGIPPAELERIFEKFQQVGSVLTDKPHGAGLGLAICKEIVEHHDGRIWVESQLGSGSTFIFTLPLANSPELLLLGDMVAVPAALESAH